ncbi:MAG TPA: molecular chaperone TorD family protein [Actinomycetota bacterium]
MATEVRADTAQADLALARSTAYRLLSQAFAYPTPKAAEQLLEEDLPLALAVSAPLPPNVRWALDEAATAFGGVSRDELEEAYRDVFSHVHSADCPMYETDYTERDVWRQTRELADLGGFYRAFGLEEQGERPDGLSVELEFMHLATYKAAWALVQRDPEHAEICRRAQESFLRDHLLKWVPELADRVVAIARTGPYAAVARLAREFLRGEARAFGMEIEQVEPTEEVPDARAAEEIGLCEGGP